MGVDYHTCKLCKESVSEYECSYVVIDGNEIPVCEYCIKHELENGNLIKLDECSDEYETMSLASRKNIENFGCIYRRTNNGILERLQEIEKELKSLLKEKSELEESLTN